MNGNNNNHAKIKPLQLNKIHFMSFPSVVKLCKLVKIRSKQVSTGKRSSLKLKLIFHSLHRWTSSLFTFYSFSTQPMSVVLLLLKDEDEEACKKELAINYLSHAGYLHLSSSSLHWPFIDSETAERQVVCRFVKSNMKSWNVEK